MTAKHTEILADITKSCRLCLSTENIVRDIFHNTQKSWAETDISAHILQATNITVKLKLKDPGFDCSDK